MEKIYERVQVSGWPNYRDFRGNLICEIDAPRGKVSVIECDMFMCDEEMHLVPSEYVTQVTSS